MYYLRIFLKEFRDHVKKLRRQPISEPKFAPRTSEEEIVGTLTSPFGDGIDVTQ
jgi:hypothetical protein